MIKLTKKTNTVREGKGWNFSWKFNSLWIWIEKKICPSLLLTSFKKRLAFNLQILRLSR